MKKSEEIKQEIERLEKEYNEKLEAEVYAMLDTDTPEQHDMRWESFWNLYGKQAGDRIAELRFDYSKEVNREVDVGDGVTLRLWSDREAYTVIKRTRCTLTIQRDKATRDPSFQPQWVTGGFSAICTNDSEQKWILERDPNGRIEKCRWSEKNGCWQTGPDGSIKVVAGRREHYDYNF